MKLNNPFPDNVRLLFIDVYWCFSCERSDRGLELHHITGRDSCSMINAIPLCLVCHSAIKHTKQEETRLREISLIYFIGRKMFIPKKDKMYLKDIDYPLYTRYKSVLK